MKIEQIEQVDTEIINKKLKKIIISNHGVEYTITSDFLGIKVSSDCDRIVVHPNDVNEVILAGGRCTQ